MVWYWIIGLMYAGVCVYLGFYTGKKATSTKSYLIGDRSFGPFVIACTWAATWVSASCFLGAGGLSYRYGWPGLVSLVPWLGGLVFPLVVAGKRLHLFTDALNVVSIADYLGTRVDSKFVRSFVSLIVIGFYVPVIMAQFKGAGVATAALMNIPYEWAVLGAGLIIVFYNTMGGFRADAYSDVFQSLVMALAVIIAIPSVIWALGGFNAINLKLAAQDPGLIAFTEPKLFTLENQLLAFLFVPGVALAGPIYTVRFQVMRDWRILKKVLIYAAIFSVLFNFVVFMGVAARAEYGLTLKNADMAIPTLVMDKLHPILGALLIIGILAAMMSTTDSLMLVVGTALAHDILKKSYWENIEDRRMLMISRTIMILIGFICLFLAFVKPPPFLSLLLYFGLGGMGASFLGPLLLTLYSKKITKTACVIAIPLSLVFYIVIYFKQFGIGFSVWKAGLIGMVFSIAVTYILSLITKQTISEETMKKVSKVI